MKKMLNETVFYDGDGSGPKTPFARAVLTHLQAETVLQMLGPPSTIEDIRRDLQAQHDRNALRAHLDRHPPKFK